MRKRTFTILVIPSGKGKTLRFTVDSFVLSSFAVFCFVFAAATLYFSYDFFAEQFDRNQLADLEDENRLLSEKISDMHETVGNLKDSYADLVEQEKAIRVMFDLPAIDEQERQLGIGGPELFDLSHKSNSEKLAYKTELSIDELARLSSFETRQYKSIYDKILAKKSKLDHTPSIMPCAGYLTRGYGIMAHPISKFKCMHNGIDVANRTGTPIYATADGVVASTGNKGRLGKTIVLDHGNGLKTRYGHLNKYTVRVGQKVKRGDKIAEMGDTGYSTNTHLHYEVTVNGQAVNPMKYIVTTEMMTRYSSL